MVLRKLIVKLKLNFKIHQAAFPNDEKQTMIDNAEIHSSEKIVWRSRFYFKETHTILFARTYWQQQTF